MHSLSRFAALLSTLVAALLLHADPARATPLTSHSATLVARDILSDHGSSCTYWTDQEPNGYYRLKIKCDKVGRGLKVAAHYNNLNQVVQSASYNSDRRVEDLNFQWFFGTSGMPDMGNCNSQLVEVEQIIKNAWYNSMTCTDISPYLKVRAVLDLPGAAINQYSEWIQTPGTVNTLERESWFGKPSAYAQWTVRDA
ncbi:hypothetical protein LTS17_007958 [Exophiala oligosperma]